MILHLTLHKKWFKEIAAGQKKVEYREIKDYWDRRLDGREYREIHFKNGYQKNAPFMRVEFLGISKTNVYEIRLGKILELRMP